MKNIIGTMRLPEGHEKTKEWLKDCHKQGINWIDTAYVYGVEERLGSALEELKEEGINFKIQTKIWTSDFKKVKEALKGQLKNLRMEKVDSLLLHRPSINFLDSIAAWRDLIELQKNGFTEEIGVSNFEAEMIEILIKETNVKPKINQIELSISNWREDRVFFNDKNGIEIQAWSIYGKDIKTNMNEPVVIEMASDHKVNPGTILSSYLTTQNIIPIHASLNKNHLADSLRKIKLSESEINKLKKLNTFNNKFEVSYPF